MTQEEVHKINQLILEAYIYLPYKLACELSETVVKREKRPSYKDFFIQVRRHILSATPMNPNDELKGENIAHIILLEDSSHDERKLPNPQ